MAQYGKTSYWDDRYTKYGSRAGAGGGRREEGEGKPAGTSTLMRLTRTLGPLLLPSIAGTLSRLIGISATVDSPSF
jgi:hypothetical protein